MNQKAGIYSFLISVHAHNQSLISGFVGHLDEKSCFIYGFIAKLLKFQANPKIFSVLYETYKAQCNPFYLLNTTMTFLE